VAEIRTVAVIGAGVSGRAIACAAALCGYRIILEDILPSSLRRADAEMRVVLPLSAMARIEYASTVEEAARQADLVIEAVPDELESKLEIFVLLDKICRPQTILALNSSTVSVEDVASVTYRPQKCIGIRFFDSAPPHMRVELVRGERTDGETIAACVDVARQMEASGA
jgi:3-hydroxybutyryl-CoA dehydrogenase